MNKTTNLCVQFLVLCALLASSLAACGGSTTETPREFKSEAGGFSVTTPYALEATTQSVDTEAGKIEIHVFQAQRGQRDWSVGYSDYPAEIVRASDPEGLLGAVRDGAVSNVKGELVSDAPISLNEYPGREFVVGGQRQGEQGLSVRARIFLVGNGLYQIMAAVPKGQENSQEVQDFLKSFRLVGK